MLNEAYHHVRPVKVLFEWLWRNVLIGLASVMRQEKEFLADVMAQGKYVVPTSGIVLKRNTLETSKLPFTPIIGQILGIKASAGADIESILLNMHPRMEFITFLFIPSYV